MKGNCMAQLKITRRMTQAGVDALQGILGGWGRLTIFDAECVQAIYRAMVRESQSARSVQASTDTRSGDVVAVDNTGWPLFPKRL
jgi:hypothetical protein